MIGNSGYQFAPKLTNPRNDAADVAAALRKYGFQVVDGFDLDKAAFDRKVRDFASVLKGAEAGVLFYAGHGLQVGGQNYLVPIDAKAEEADALKFEMLRVDVIHRIMERQTNTNILFLDACRDNPLARNLARSMGTRSAEIGSGLARIETGVGTLISFSTQPRNVALDGTGRNSPFAGALVKQLSTSNDDLSAILIAVRNDVMQQTQRKQVPWENSALTGRFYFKPAAETAEPAKVAPARLSEAAEAWGATRDTASVTVLEAFIVRYKDTFYAELARARLDELNKERVALSIPPKKPEPAQPSAPDVEKSNAGSLFEFVEGSSVDGREFIEKGEFTQKMCQQECLASLARCKMFAFSLKRPDGTCYLFDRVFPLRRGYPTFTVGTLRDAKKASEDDAKAKAELKRAEPTGVPSSGKSGTGPIFEVTEGSSVDGREFMEKGKFTQSTCQQECLESQGRCKVFAFSKNQYDPATNSHTGTCYLFDRVLPLRRGYPTFTVGTIRN